MILDAEIGLAKIQEEAKRLVLYFLVNKAEIVEQTPATIQAAYTFKAQQAAVVLAGGTSVNECIEREAAMRGYTPFEMATVIDYMAGVSIEGEVQRMAINVRIEQAANESEVVAILDELGLILNITS